MFIPIEIIHKICEYISIEDTATTRLASHDFYKGCQRSLMLKKKQLQLFIMSDSSHSTECSNLMIQKDDTDVYSILKNNVKVARIEYKTNIKLYDLNIFETDEWVSVIGYLLKNVGVGENDEIHFYKSNIFVLLYRGRMKLNI